MAKLNEKESGLIKDVVNELLSEIEAIYNEKDDLYKKGQVLAYANTLGIIKGVLQGYDLKEYGLDFDIDKKYLI